VSTSALAASFEFFASLVFAVCLHDEAFCLVAAAAAADDDDDDDNDGDGAARRGFKNELKLD
jgi:hypothetical protein